MAFTKGNCPTKNNRIPLKGISFLCLYEEVFIENVKKSKEQKNISLTLEKNYKERTLLIYNNCFT